MDLRTFALQNIRRKNYNTEVWIPLRVSTIDRKGAFGSAEYSSDFFGLTSVAIPVHKVEAATGVLNWHTTGLNRDHTGYVEKSIYHPADLFEEGEFAGVNLIISQRSCNGEAGTWHVHPDLIATLNLRREGNSWTAPEEGYIEVIRYTEKADGSPATIEIRAEFLKDYLCARRLALHVSFYSEMEVNVENVSGLDWDAFDAEEISDGKTGAHGDEPVRRRWRRELSDGKWEGSVIPIHEGGHPFGSGFAVIFAGRKDFDYEQSVPEISARDEMQTSTRTGQFTGRLLYRVIGEIWRNQWVLPASSSVRVSRDKVPSTCFFVIDAAGTRRSADQLRDGQRWLWFNPAAVPASLSYRGASLSWYTRETGCIAMATDGGVTFGINELGLVNVYAKDIAYMPMWQQKVWSGFNVAPDGGVSRELLAGQAEGIPAKTLAPEAFLAKARDQLDRAILQRFGCRVFRGHAGVESILSCCHRFRALDKQGVFELAKDLARITADDIDSKPLQKIVPLEPGERRGSLKSLERVIAKVTDTDFAACAMTPLFAIYELRLADAHLAGSDPDTALRHLNIDPNLPHVLQGRDILIALVDALFRLARSLQKAAAAST